MPDIRLNYYVFRVDKKEDNSASPYFIAEDHPLESICSYEKNLSNLAESLVSTQKIQYGVMSF